VLFVLGFLKKACISDNLAPHVDAVFAAPTSFAAYDVFGGVLLYAVQIYCDFSGYTDMAIASAGLLGFSLPPNFAAPYFSVDIIDFWRRWHISLSTWLRDYLYIPLGGNRSGPLSRYRNLMTTMLLGGLWHGAAWTFVCWGFLHGAALVVNHLWNGVRAKYGMARQLPVLLSTALTFYVVCIGWILFRSPDFGTAATILRAFVTLDSPGTARLPIDPLLPVALLAVAAFASARVQLGEWICRRSLPAFGALQGAAWALAIALLPTGYAPFIYFQF
jgi:D-alanyl-lipoteichoic acid acyltransferase DltB (MBOAT superfamily)